MCVRKLGWCAFLLVLTIVLCEARRFRFGSSRWRRSSRVSWGSRSQDTYHSSRRYTESKTSRRGPVGHGYATRSPPIRVRPVTSRNKVTVPTAGPDNSFRKLNTGRNYYQPPPTLKPLYPMQGQSFHPQPIVVNQPVYVNPYASGGHHDNTLLGTYLGYQMGRHLHGHHHHSDGYYNPPSYAVVHHHYHYDRPVPTQIRVEEDVMGQCGNLTGFCTPKTTALCLTNGTVYCLAPQEATIPCPLESLAGKSCVNSTVTIPCIGDTTCDHGTSNVTTISIPCISHMDLNVDVYSILVGKTASGTGEVSKYCVTLIAEPLVVSKNMTNEEFLAHVRKNAETEEFFNAKHANLMYHFLKPMFSLY